MKEHEIAKDFSRETRKALRKAGRTIIGHTWLPDAKGAFANGERGYEIDDRGTLRIRTYLDVLAMAIGM